MNISIIPAACWYELNKRYHKAGSRLFLVTWICIFISLGMLAYSSYSINKNPQTSTCDLCEYRHTICVITNLSRDNATDDFAISLKYATNNYDWNHSTQITGNDPSKWNYADLYIGSAQTCIYRLDNMTDISFIDYRIYDNNSWVKLESGSNYIYFGILLISLFTVIAFCSCIFIPCWNNSSTDLSCKCVVTSLIACQCAGVGVIIIGSVMLSGYNAHKGDISSGNIYMEMECRILTNTDVIYFNGMENMDLNEYVMVRYGVTMDDQSVLSIGVGISEMKRNSTILAIDSTQTCYKNKDNNQVYITEDYPSIDWLGYPEDDSSTMFVMGTLLICVPIILCGYANSKNGNCCS